MRDDPALLGDMPGQDDPAVAHATDIEAVRVHLDELPEREQRVLIWRFYGNLTQSQIGDRLGISQMHVSRLLDRVISALSCSAVVTRNGTGPLKRGSAARTVPGRPLTRISEHLLAGAFCPGCATAF